MAHTLTQTFPITGMTCMSCAGKVEARLKQHSAIQDATVTVEPSQARVTTTQALGEDEVTEWLKPLQKYRVGSSTQQTAKPNNESQAKPVTYKPLIILLGYLLAITVIVSWPGHWETGMRIFMAGFFIAFSFFKMLDLKGFAETYRGYDLVARAWPAYAFVYPFIELGLGLAYLADFQPVLVNAVTAVVMGVSLIGVLRAVLSKQTIRCACLGTVFNLPMSTVTLVEDGLMLLMAIVMLIMHLG